MKTTIDAMKRACNVIAFTILEDQASNDGHKTIEALREAIAREEAQTAILSSALHPPKDERVPMTDAEIDPIVRDAIRTHMTNFPSVAINAAVEVAYEVARAVLAARGER